MTVPPYVTDGCHTHMQQPSTKAVNLTISSVTLLQLYGWADQFVFMHRVTAL